MDDNKLIAEFMGMKYSDKRSYDNGEWTHSIESLSKFQTSWDWLMPVVKRCWEIANELEIGFDEMTLEHRFDCIAYGDLDESYEAVVEFIKAQVCHVELQEWEKDNLS